MNDSAITLTWRSKTELISGFLIEATPTSLPAGFIPIQRNIGPSLRSYAITGELKQAFGGRGGGRLVMPSSGTFVFLTVLFITAGLEPGTNYKINIYTLKGNGRSAPFTLTASTGQHQLVKRIF